MTLGHFLNLVIQTQSLYEEGVVVEIVPAGPSRSVRAESAENNVRGAGDPTARLDIVA